MLYEVAIIEQPKVSKDDPVGVDVLVLPPICVIAKDTQGAAIEAVLSNAEKLKDVDSQRMQVLVRPFA